MMRSFVSRFAASAAFAIAILTSFGAPAQPAAEPPAACAALSAAEPAKVIEACTALIDNPATPEGDRLDATITRAAALHNSGQTARPWPKSIPLYPKIQIGPAPSAPVVKF